MRGMEERKGRDETSERKKIIKGKKPREEMPFTPTRDTKLATDNVSLIFKCGVTFRYPSVGRVKRRELGRERGCEGGKREGGGKSG